MKVVCSALHGSSQMSCKQFEIPVCGTLPQDDSALHPSKEGRL
jgi:hypothetical protein